MNELSPFPDTDSLYNSLSSRAPARIMKYLPTTQEQTWLSGRQKRLVEETFAIQTTFI